MNLLKKLSGHFSITLDLLKWTCWVLPIAAVTGSAVALFLWLLDKVTLTRWGHRWLLFLLPVAGGMIVIGLTWLLGTSDYLGLGVTTADGKGVSIISAFREGGAGHWSWLWKMVFTVVTLSSGFKGGEVTPLFFIGATLGNTLAWLMGAPVDLFAGLGFIAVFAGATNTPLACTMMGIELFGGEHSLYFAIACFTAYFFSGHSGIYSAQKIAVPKSFK